MYLFGGMRREMTAATLLKCDGRAEPITQLPPMLESSHHRSAVTAFTCRLTVVSHWSFPRLPLFSGFHCYAKSKMRDDYNAKENVTHNYVTATIQETLDTSAYLKKKMLSKLFQRQFHFRLWAEKGDFWVVLLPLISIYYSIKGSYCCLCSHFLFGEKQFDMLK